MTSATLPQSAAHHGRSRRRSVALVAAVVLACATVLGGCGERESERLGRELAERLRSEGYQVSKALAWPPRGTVPHWVVEIDMPGGEAEAGALCRHVEATVTYDAAPVYLIRVSYQPVGAVECGWARDPGASPESTPSPGT